MVRNIATAAALEKTLETDEFVDAVIMDSNVAHRAKGKPWSMCVRASEGLHGDEWQTFLDDFYTSENLRRRGRIERGLKT